MKGSVTCATCGGGIIVLADDRLSCQTVDCPNNKEKGISDAERFPNRHAAQLLFKRTLLETRSRISAVEADVAGLTIHELVDAGFRLDGDNGYRLES